MTMGGLFVALHPYPESLRWRWTFGRFFATMPCPRFLPIRDVSLRHHVTFIFAFVFLAGLGLSAARVSAQPAVEALQKRLDDAMPGTTIELPAAVLNLKQPLRLSRSGTETAPITLRAKDRGKTVISGKAGIELIGAGHVIIEGLSFTHESRTPAIRLVDCQNVRITRCSFRLDGTGIQRQNWIHISGSKSGQNRIDHNLFEDLATAGAYIAIDGSEAAPFQISKSDRIDYNHFRAIARRTGGGARAVRLGWTKLADSTSQTVMEFNLFEQCSGDEEIVTVRASGAAIRFNTFMNSAGYLCLRLGKENQAEGNFFFSENRDGVGGIRVHGEQAKVFNNYFEGLTVPAVVLSNGSSGGGTIEAPRPAAKGANIVFNTWVNCGGGALEIGSTGGGILLDAPTDCVIANNVAIGYGDELIRMRSKPEIKWAGNIMFHAGAKEKVGLDVPEAQINVTFPKLRNQGGIWRLGPNSPAIDAADGEYEFVATDVDGQPRPKKKDAGSDEFATGPIKQRPFTAIDVGVEAP